MIRLIGRPIHVLIALYSMVTIEPVDSSQGRPRLGMECRFALRGDAFTAVDYFLEHDGVMYPRPLPAHGDGWVRVFPEAPGHYALHAAWRSANGAQGWTRTEFDVSGAHASAPRQVTAQGDTQWVPTAWDAQLLGTHEAAIFGELEKVVRPGATVYDIGANVGLFSVRFARWIGREGWLYAIEPNPICVYFLRANLQYAGARRFTILPIAVSSDHGDCEFVLSYGSSLIGVGSDSPYGWKPGHRIRVDAESLDQLIATLRLRKPDFIKLDVEGAEASAVAGMMDTLLTARPGLMIELHGRESAARTLPVLAELGYEYFLSSSCERYRTTQDLLNSMPDACVQIVGYP